MKVKEGLKFGRLEVISGGKNRKWLCLCECGELRSVFSGNLTAGRTKSCGCLRRDIVVTHGLSQVPLYGVWDGMMRRCYSKNHKYFRLYGQRGVRVCDSWLSPVNFIKWGLSNGYKKGLQLDKDIIGTGLLYSPENCMFVTPKQNNNKKSNNRILTHNGISLTVSEWGDKIGIKPKTLHQRLANGWSTERLIETPCGKYVRKK